MGKTLFKGKAPFFLHHFKFTQDILHYQKDGYYKENPYQEVGIKQLTRRDPNEVSRGLRLGYFIQIRNIINEELELVWNDSKTPQEAMDNAVKRSNQQLREFEKIYK